MHDWPRDCASGRRALLHLLLLAGFCMAAGTAVRADAADAPRELHGMADAFAAPGIALAWGVVRGASEATTTVVVRIVTDPTKYGWIGVVGIDPFSKQEQLLRPATSSTGVIDIREPRVRFADFPRTEVRLYESEATVQSGTPALTVFYLGVPDTTPEFTSEDKLEAYLADRVARLRASGSKTP
jgi:hypothetical protein